MNRILFLEFTNKLTNKQILVYLQHIVSMEPSDDFDECTKITLITGERLYVTEKYSDIKKFMNEVLFKHNN